MKLNEILKDVLLESQNYLDMYEAVANRLYNYLIELEDEEVANQVFEQYMRVAKEDIRDNKNILNRRDFVVYMGRIGKLLLLRD